MAKIKGFKSEAPVKGFPMLPNGAYVAGIKNVKMHWIPTFSEKRLKFIRLVHNVLAENFYSEAWSHVWSGLF